MLYNSTVANIQVLAEEKLSYTETFKIYVTRPILTYSYQINWPHLSKGIFFEKFRKYKIIFIMFLMISLGPKWGLHFIRTENLYFFVYREQSFCKVCLKRTLDTCPTIYIFINTFNMCTPKRLLKNNLFELKLFLFFIHRQIIFIYYFICIRSTVLKGRREPMDTLCSI